MTDHTVRREDWALTKTRTLLAEAAERAKDEINEAFNAAAKRCSTPIELVMLARLATMSQPYSVGILPPINFVWDGDPHSIPARAPGEIAVFPQWQIGSYRTDFLIEFTAPTGHLLRFVVECDGHDFHEKTKEQAAHDKERDRVLQGQGYAVFRFTGSEIYRNSDDLLRPLEAAMVNFAEAEISRRFDRGES